jgi:hypothetical protein
MVGFRDGSGGAFRAADVLDDGNRCGILMQWAVDYLYGVWLIKPKYRVTVFEG